MSFLTDMQGGFSDILAELGESVTYSLPGADGVPVTVLWSRSDDPRVAFTAEVLAASLPEGYAKRDKVMRGSTVYEVRGFIGANGSTEDIPYVDDIGAVKLALRYSEAING